MEVLDFFFSCSWIAFWLYWFISATQSDKNSRVFTKSTIIPRLLLIIIILIAIFRSGHNNNSFNNYGNYLGHGLALHILGTILFVAGLLFAIWARINLGKHWGMPMTLKQNPQLITTGPYRYVRHPIYAGILFGGLGTALALGGYWIVPLLIMGIYFVYSAIVEEKIMAKQFPKIYSEYKEKTKMFIPFLF